MALGASGDGEFISKYEDDVLKNDEKFKRSVSEGDVTSNERKVLIPVKLTKRSTAAAKKAHKRDQTATAAVVRAPQDIEASFRPEATAYCFCQKFI